MGLRNLVRSFPFPLKQGLRYVYGVMPLSIRYGKVFQETYAFLNESQWWSRDKLEDYQTQQLGNLLNHVYENVPYYRSIFNELGLRPRDIQCPYDLKQLPYLTKDIFKRNFNELVARKTKLDNAYLSDTSGTTGKPLQFYENKYIEEKELAFIHHQWSRVGLSPGDSVIQLRGKVINSNNKVCHDPIRRILRFSPRIEDREIACYYLEKMRKFGAKYLHGYSSTIGMFASIIKKYGLSVPFKLRAVLFSSENIYSWQREIVEEVFNCRVFSHYGLTEKVVLAGECESSYCYHCMPQYGITEIDSDSNAIVGTGFLNYLNPFIRYRTTDVASEPISMCHANCGREYFPVFSGVEGRLEDFIITREGVHISPATIPHILRGLRTIRDTQIVQESFEYIKLRIVPWDNCDPSILKGELCQLSKGLRAILNSNMDIETDIVDSIEASKSGKLKWIISKVSQNSLQEGVTDA